MAAGGGALPIQANSVAIIANLEWSPTGFAMLAGHIRCRTWQGSYMPCFAEFIEADGSKCPMGLSAIGFVERNITQNILPLHSRQTAWVRAQLQSRHCPRTLWDSSTSPDDSSLSLVHDLTPQQVTPTTLALSTEHSFLPALLAVFKRDSPGQYGEISVLV